MNEWRTRAYAKINLSLDVLGKREDGYHEVRMVMQSIDLYDHVWLQKTEESGIALTVDKPYLPTDDRNLMVRAAKLMFERFSLPGGLRMKLDKYIPVAAGMAGGSTDAAAVFRGINALYGLGLSDEALMALGVTLGADIPYCIQGKTMLSEGIGEKLTRLPDCPKCYIIAAKPAFSVSTKGVYEEIDRIGTYPHPDTEGLIEGLKRGDLLQMTSCMGNVLEYVTGSRYPVIGQIEANLRENGALKAMMSGSGPTVFGVFDDLEKAKFALRALRQAHLSGNTFLCDPIQSEN